MDLQSKVCVRCSTSKPIASFFKEARRTDGLQGHCKLCETERQRSYKLRNPEKVASYNRAWRFRTQYGIELDEYDRLLAAQGGGCAICGCSEPRKGTKYLHVDHDHATGIVRGLLCGGCNTALGLFGDDAERLIAAAAYLRGGG